MHRLRNNLIAGLIVIIFLIGVAKSEPIVTDSTSVVTSTGTLEEKLIHIANQVDSMTTTTQLKAATVSA